jgi:copper resistance protein B
MRIEETPGRRSRAVPFAACAVFAAFAAFAAGSEGAAAQQPSGAAPMTGDLEPHATLEDPLNRSFLLDQFETRERDGGRDLAWDARFWAGYAFDKVVLRTEGEKRGGDTEHAELELLWSHAIAPWWEILAGARTDFAPGASQTWAACGVQGLAPYRFEVDATAYLADGGSTAARVEGKYELLITPRLVLQPQVEIEWHGQSDAARGIGAGLAGAEMGLRLRYEFRREIAPYVGLVRERSFGRTADLRRAAGEDPDDTRLVAGVRVRF